MTFIGKYVFLFRMIIKILSQQCVQGIIQQRNEFDFKFKHHKCSSLFSLFFSFECVIRDALAFVCLVGTVNIFMMSFDCIL